MLRLLGVLFAAATITDLPELPQPIAGQFVGMLGNLLVVAGGSWWTAPPGEGGEKIWVDDIQVLEPGARAWRHAGKLPEPIAYGAAVSFPRRMVFLGGQNGDKISSTVKAISDGFLRLSLPNLPEPLTNLSAARIGETIYAVGGQNTAASNHLWRLDSSEKQWTAGPDLPGEGRILASVVACGGQLYVLGGAALTPARKYLKEAWTYHPKHGWQRLPDLPYPAAAAPVVCGSKQEPVLIGGDDGALAGQTVANHPGFRRTVLQLSNGVWSTKATVPIGLVTTGAVPWNDSIVIPGGEDRPGHRSSQVLRLNWK